jgi:hypothetical protein
LGFVQTLEEKRQNEENEKKRRSSKRHDLGVIDIPSGRYFLVRGFFVAGGRPSPSLFLGRTNFLGGIAAVRYGSSGGGDGSGGWIGEKWRENG